MGQWVMSRPGDRGAYEVGNVRIVLSEENNREAQELRKAAKSRHAKAA
jgi:hypothetical protein